MPDIAVFSGQGADASRACELAERLGLPVSSDRDSHEFLFQYSPDGLCLIHHDAGQRLSLCAEWLEGKAAHRMGQPEMVSRALGLQKLDHPHVVDATAGLGRDTVVLANLGANVSAIERSPWVFALLEDARQRACGNPAAAPWASNISLFKGDAIEMLATVAASQPVDLVYLDPMYPEKSKKALAKKDMRLFQRLLGHAGEDEAQLLQAARDQAIYRVVVKRPIKGRCLADVRPSFSIRGRSTRFDVYTQRKLG